MAKTQYGLMPEQPKALQLCKIKGDAGVYEVVAIDWLNRRIGVFRAQEAEWHSIDKVAFVSPETVDVPSRQRQSQAD